MGHDKLRKFAENETFACLLQPDAASVLDKTADPSRGLVLKDHPIKGHWNGTMFSSPAPIVLELGCGKGEYTIDLSRRSPEANYIGVDIKGARLWKGAKTATQEKLPNVAFLRTRIEFIDAFFAPEEVSEVWLTFSDPQLKSENCRLSSPLFLERYRRFLKPGGIVHLKTDSRFLHEYTKAVVRENGLTMLACTEDLYGEGRSSVMESPMRSVCGVSAVEALFEVRTFYERMFMEQGYKITYLSFVIDHEGDFRSPSGFDSDYWRSTEGPRHFAHSPEKKKTKD
ncbi:MAG: tRNA (guanosine(46)-N7)-methyltransferase TrmB [Candidatus Cryptobacteroides sp.]